MNVLPEGAILLPVSHATVMVTLFLDFTTKT